MTDLAGPPIAYATLRQSLWLPYLVCSLSLLCTYPVLLRMPETLSKARQEEEQEVQGGGEAHKAMERTGLAAYNKFLKDRRILVGIITVFLAQFRNNTIEILLPYTSIRFGLKLGEVIRPRTCYPAALKLD